MSSPKALNFEIWLYLLRLLSLDSKFLLLSYCHFLRSITFQFSQKQPKNQKSCLRDPHLLVMHHKSPPGSRHMECHLSGWPDIKGAERIEPKLKWDDGL